MGDLDQKGKVGGGTQVGGDHAGPAPATPGKSTQTGGQEGAPGQIDAENDKNQRPDRYATLDIDIVDLLWKSRETYLVGEGITPTTPFWKRVDTIKAPDLQTLVQIHRRLTDAGIWGAIGPLKSVYTFGSSWGIHFIPATDLLGIVSSRSWGKDFPQGPVQDEHGAHGKDYTWYRQATGAGNAGMHMGLGANDSNVHVDPTNPMDHVSYGIEHVGPIPVYIPIGCAVYSPSALAEHLKDIWNIGDPVEHAATPQPFLSIGQLEYFAGKGLGLADREASAKVKPQHVGRRDAAVAQVRAARPMVTALQPKSRALAMQDTSKNKSAIDALKNEFLAARHQLFEGLAKLFSHMHADIEGIPPNKRVLGKESEWDEKQNMMDWACDKYNEYVAQRTWNDPTKTIDDL